MPIDPDPPLPPRPAMDTPGGPFSAALGAGGPLDELVSKAEAREALRRREVAEVARRAADLTADPRPTGPGSER